MVCMGDWQGQQVLGMLPDWNKRYITLAPIATVLGLAFKLSDPDRLLGGEEELGITCALIPTSTPGVEIGRRHFPLNVPFQNGPTAARISSCRSITSSAPEAWPVRAGACWLNVCPWGRGITLPSNATGGPKSVAMATGATPIFAASSKFPSAKWKGLKRRWRASPVTPT
ncbi:hypothetical protein LNP25_13560 [Klebsiella variicola subsp. variicola]|nr:hypothetical protein [Klebsiella variicola subsp. variicola]